MLSTLRALANAFLGKTGKPGHLDTATRMAMDADFSGINGDICIIAG